MAASAKSLFLFCLVLIPTLDAAVAPPNEDGSWLPPADSAGDLAISVNNFCLSWRLGVETNNVRAWRTVPPQCCGAGGYINGYMVGSGQYLRDVELAVDQILDYATDVIADKSDGTDYDGKDAWVMDVDDTCISNAGYYKVKRSYGCLPFDSVSFRAWASKAQCPAIQAVLGLFENLRELGFKVFLISGRDEEGLGEATRLNLIRQGFVGYERLVLRPASYRGVSAVVYKSEMRRRLMEDEGYRIWGNVGDQWTDLIGHSLGNRTFKLPNPMYFVP
ncbi:Acid phosphatase 1 [Linum perenne]